MAKEFDWISFIIGVLVGMIIILVIVWLIYYSRWFMFSYCPTTLATCLKDDYLTIEEALAEGHSLQALLKYDPTNNTLLHVRQPRISTCSIGSNQVEKVDLPQYCIFNINGKDQIHKYVYSSDNLIRYQNIETDEIIFANNHCDGSNAYNKMAVAGKPMIKWDKI